MSGMGLSGGTARCYDWYMDLLKCMDEETAPMQQMRAEKCKVYHEDYFECLHSEKRRMREHLIERERRRQKAQGKVFSWEAKEAKVVS